MKKIITSVGMIVFAGALVAGGTGAFFSDTETSTGNVFTAGSIDLSLGSDTSSTNDANGVEVTNVLLANNSGRSLFNFTDLKPGDDGAVVFNLMVTSNPSYLCADTALMVGEENLIVDPEADAGDNTYGAGQGELQNYIQFATFADFDLDGLYDAGVEPVNVNQYAGGSIGFTNAQIDAAGNVPVADTTSPNTWLTIASLTPGTEYGAGMLYCFGNFTTSGTLNTTQVIGCDGGPIGAYNDAQTDSAVGSITFSAVQTRNNEEFTCQPPVVVAS